PSHQGKAAAIVHYKRPSRKEEGEKPTSVQWPDPDTTSCQDEPLESLVPLFPIKAEEPQKTFTINIGGGFNASGNFLWTMNGQSFVGNFNDPTLLDAVKGQTEYPANQNMFRTENAKTF